MIHVIYHRVYNKVTIDGHAQSGEHGHDLVCAAVSALAYTLANAVENMYQSNQCKERQCLLHEGEAVITCKPLTRYTSVVTLMFDLFCSGFEMLAHNYPANISYKVLG